MSIPEIMECVWIDEFGGPEVMSIKAQPVPVYKPQEVLIKVHYAGVNRPDIMQRQGNYPPPQGASPVLGLEVAGEVVAVGATADKFAVGDQVCALTNGGAYSQYVSVPQTQCLPIPTGLSLEQAASLPETYFTVWDAVFTQAKLQASERFLVHGGSSGIGVAAIQIAKAFGASVYTTAGTQAKCDFCHSIGADLAVNYREDDFVERIKDQIQDDGIDVVLDMVAGDYVPRNIKLCGHDARIVIIAGNRGFKAELNLLPLMMKRIHLTGSTLRPRPEQYKSQIAQNLKSKVWPLIEQGRIKPVIDRVFDLKDVSNAHRLMESSQHMGKIILKVI